MNFKYLIALTITLISCFSSLSTATASDITPKIIGGEDIDEAQPWMVSIQLNDPFISHFCGGVLIDPEWVLTAAHCMEDFSASDIKLVIGALELNGIEGEQILATDIISHQSYDTETVDNDIAVIKLASPSFNAPIDMATTTETLDVTEGTLLAALGWGATAISNFSTTLQIADIPMRTQSQCESIFGPLDDDIVCAGFLEGGADSCGGDSGGPLLIQSGNEFIHVGITSFGGEECGSHEQLGVYTKTANYSTWIADRLAGIPINTGGLASSGGGGGGAINWLLLIAFSLLLGRKLQLKKRA